MRILLIAAVAITPNIASATMPALTDIPADKSPTSCKKWASMQDEDALYMWGAQENGGTSKPAAIKRLSDYCRSGKIPSIVGVWSSDGAAADYCSTHSKAGICKAR